MDGKSINGNALKVSIARRQLITATPNEPVTKPVGWVDIGTNSKDFTLYWCSISCTNSDFCLQLRNIRKKVITLISERLLNMKKTSTRDEKSVLYDFCFHVYFVNKQYISFSVFCQLNCFVHIGKNQVMKNSY